MCPPTNSKEGEVLPPDHPTSTDQPFSSVASVNEPHGSDVWEGDTTPGDGLPPSPEEPPPTEPPPEGAAQNPTKPPAHELADPDDLEDEIDEAEDEDEVTIHTERTIHRGKPSKTLPHKKPGKYGR